MNELPMHPNSPNTPAPPDSPPAPGSTQEVTPQVAPQVTQNAVPEVSPAIPPQISERMPVQTNVAAASPRILAVMNQKGGVGKTTTTANLAAGLTYLDQKVLVIDMDPQAHLSLHFGLELASTDLNLYQLLAEDEVTVQEVIREVGSNLSIIPAQVNLAGVEAELAPKVITGQAQRVLADKVEALLQTPDRPDYIIIDCPPSLGLLAINALTLAREVVVPLQAHFLALQGLSKLFETIQLIQQGFNPKLRVGGVVLCMHEANTILASEVVADLMNFLEAGRGQDVPWADAVIYEPPIRRNIKLAESPSFGKTIFEYAPHCAGARDYERLAKSILSTPTASAS